jgi:DNA-binding response OmpR family regulator
MDGYQVCRRVRESSNIPIIMLSAKDEEHDKLRCLELGADDYLTKPFSLNELLARLKVILRRVQNTGTSFLQGKFSCGDLEIDYDRHLVYLQGENIHKPRVLWVNISRLRRKLMAGKGKYDYISTKPGMGYMIREKVKAS